MILFRWIPRARTAAWQWLLREARLHPVRSGALVFLTLMSASGFFGWLMDGLEDSVVNWLDNAFIVLGGFTLTMGWALALVVRARRREAALTFRRAGDALEDPGFRAGLILVPFQPPLLQWHLRQMQHERVELVWTELTRGCAQSVLPTLAEGVVCLHGPGRDAEEPLGDAFDLNVVKAHARTLLLEILARYPREEVCVDVTGGTAVMSVGVFQVAEELGVTSVYLMATREGENGRREIRAEHVDDPDAGRIVVLSDHRAGEARPAAQAEVASGEGVG